MLLQKRNVLIAGREGNYIVAMLDKRLDQTKPEIVYIPGRIYRDNYSLFHLQKSFLCEIFLTSDVALNSVTQKPKKILIKVRA